MVNAWNKADVHVPMINPRKAPVPVVRAQNMPNRKVANNGALTKPNTNWMTFIAFKKWLEKYAQKMLRIMPTIVVAWPTTK